MHLSLLEPYIWSDVFQLPYMKSLNEVVYNTIYIKPKLSNLMGHYSSASYEEGYDCKFRLTMPPWKII